MAQRTSPDYDSYTKRVGRDTASNIRAVGVDKMKQVYGDRPLYQVPKREQKAMNRWTGDIAKRYDRGAKAAEQGVRLRKTNSRKKRSSSRR